MEHLRSRDSRQQGRAVVLTGEWWGVKVTECAGGDVAVGWSPAEAESAGIHAVGRVARSIARTTIVWLVLAGVRVAPDGGKTISGSGFQGCE